MSGNGVKEKDVSTVNTPATVISGMDSGLVSSTVNSTLENLGDTIGKESDGLNSFPIGIAPSLFVSFATLVKGDTSHKSVNFPTLITPDGNGADVVVSKESVYVVNERLNNTLYRVLLGKCVAYPVVKNYIKNNWSKFALVKSMMFKAMFFFKFRSKDGMESMLKNSLWLIRNVPLILKKWTPNKNIMKEDVYNILIWVKFHDNPIIVFTDDGLSAIATKLGIL
ncbi:RNA-directed DNA polymerase, eukaryota [Tanacetum coccineum]